MGILSSSECLAYNFFVCSKTDDQGHAHVHDHAACYIIIHVHNRVELHTCTGMCIFVVTPDVNRHG